MAHLPYLMWCCMIDISVYWSIGFQTSACLRVRGLPQVQTVQRTAPHRALSGPRCCTGSAPLLAGCTSQQLGTRLHDRQLPVHPSLTALGAATAQPSASRPPLTHSTWGRDCTTVTSPSTHTPSMSCGCPPKAASTCCAAAAMASSTSCNSNGSNVQQRSRWRSQQGVVATHLAALVGAPQHQPIVCCCSESTLVEARRLTPAVQGQASRHSMEPLTANKW